METMIWEEKNLIEPKMSCVNKIESELNDSMKNTEIESEKKECVDIGVKNKFVKICPKCGNEQKYSTPQNYYKALKRNRQCRKCMFDSVEYRVKHMENTKNLWKTDEHKNHMEEVHMSSEYRKKRRIISQTILRNKFGSGRISHVNQNACKFIDSINEKYGWNLKHGLNGGEYEVCGYSLDGYDSEKNIVFEYDEPRHYNVYDQLKEDDIVRQKNIIKELHPTKFIRYNERCNKMVNVLTEEVL